MRTPTFLLFALYSLLLTTTLASFKFNEQGKFTILQLTDMHYCNPLWNETKADTDAMDEQTQILNKMLIETAKPDLIVLSGDAISSQIGAKQSAKQFRRCWEKVVKEIKEAGISYTYILGNHDAEGFLNATEVIKFVQEQPLNIRKGLEGIPDTCNFVLPIFSSQNEEKVAANIWHFDSGSQSCGGFEFHTWGCVEKEAVDWYDEHSQKIRKEQGTQAHHFAFVHIPLPEFADLANNGEFYGVREERVSCPNINTGLFDRIKKNSDINGIFVGHDHVNNYAGWHKGVELVYGQKSGYGAYGFIRGARVITLEEYKNKKGELKVRRSHNILFENGTIAEPTAPRKEDRDMMTVCPIYGHGPTQRIIGSFRKSFWEIKTWIKQLFD